MAYTKIIKVKSNLNLCLDYTSNPMKTERRSAEDLNKLLNYTQNNDKTEHQLYVMPPDYMGDAVTITMDAVAAATAPEITEEMYEQLDYLEKHPEENYYENEENFSQYDQGD
ncbi:MAG: hypothetical protein ACLSVH_12600, partial [Gemmiger formicilis]